jgi:XTP/dITP diphosphohydrolase
MLMDIVLASFNRGKYDEMLPLFAEKGLSLRTPESSDMTEPEETGLSFVENALIKARHAAEHFNGPVIADDSGLVVGALGGAPGVYSSRYAGARATDEKNIVQLLSNMEGVSDRFAYYYCALVFLRSADDPVPVICEGRWEGKILSSASGGYGFGYDPIFWVPTHQCSVAELSVVEKSGISHRGKALRQMFIEIQSIIRSGEVCQSH